MTTIATDGKTVAFSSLSCGRAAELTGFVPPTMDQAIQGIAA